jgi:RHS repeat-associated protein
VGDYTAWGKVKKDTEHAFSARIEQPLRYPGQYEDESTGLHYNTMRYYDPDVGRFISHDPIGRVGGENLYAYAPNPTGWMDPWGRRPHPHATFSRSLVRAAHMLALNTTRVGTWVPTWTSSTTVPRGCVPW